MIQHRAEAGAFNVGHLNEVSSFVGRFAFRGHYYFQGKI